MKLARALALAAVTLAAGAQAAMYKWTDAKGVVHYTQTPPPGSTPYEPVKPAPPPSPAPARESAQQFLQKAEAEAARQRQARAEAALKQAQARKDCDSARQRLAFLQERTPQRLAVKQQNGELARMTVEEWEARKAEAQQLIDESCG